MATPHPVRRPPQRDQREILDEMLLKLRNIERSLEFRSGMDSVASGKQSIRDWRREKLLKRPSII